VKLLLDENLSPVVAQVLSAEGFDVCHIRDRSMLQASDHDVLEKAFTEDRILVTANVGDFMKLARARELHAGIVLIENAGLLRDEQIEIVRRACIAIDGQQDMVNRVLRIGLDDSVVVEEIPPGDAPR